MYSELLSTAIESIQGNEEKNGLTQRAEAGKHAMLPRSFQSTGKSATKGSLGGLAGTQVAKEQ